MVKKLEARECEPPPNACPGSFFSLPPVSKEFPPEFSKEFAPEFCTVKVFHHCPNLHLPLPIEILGVTSAEEMLAFRFEWI